jgi:hypothetical protein
MWASHILLERELDRFSFTFTCNFLGKTGMSVAWLIVSPTWDGDVLSDLKEKLALSRSYGGRVKFPRRPHLQV